MCMMLYMACDVPLPEINPGAGRSMSVQLIDEPLVAAHFRSQHIYFVGSYQGCACGFVCEKDKDYPWLGRELERAARYEDHQRCLSVAALKNYVRDNLQQTRRIELFSCWAGDEIHGPSQSEELAAGEFADRNPFRLEEGRRYILRA